MDRPRATALDDRGILRIAGEDRAPFLQGLISNDIMKASPSRALWWAFLTPQGKFLDEIEWYAEALATQRTKKGVPY